MVECKKVENLEQKEMLTMDLLIKAAAVLVLLLGFSLIFSEY